MGVITQTIGDVNVPLTFMNISFIGKAYMHRYRFTKTMKNNRIRNEFIDEIEDYELVDERCDEIYSIDLRLVRF